MRYFNKYPERGKILGNSTSFEILRELSGAVALPYQIQKRLLRFGRHLIGRSAKESVTAKEGTISEEFIATFLPENPIVVEAGAYTGSDTKRMSKLWRKGIIHAFEPVPELFQRLTAKTYKLENVRRYPLALSETYGVAKMFISGGASIASSSILSPKEHLAEHPDVVFQSEIYVHTTSLDRWAEEHDIERVDFMWLDMQGAEAQALRGGSNVLKSVRAIYTEVCLTELYDGAPLYSELRHWLEVQGFRVEREEFVGPEGNVLFVR